LDWFYDHHDGTYSSFSIIQGGATGADNLALSWHLKKPRFDKENIIKNITYEPDWDTYKRAAGPIRNKEMLEANPDALVLAFPGGKGTEDCVKQAKELGMIVLRVEK